MKFKDRIVIVTGGSRGIGRAISRSFARQGACVFVNYSSDDDAASSLVDETKDCRHHVALLKGEVSSTAQVNEMVQKILSTHDRIDVLVNNAGIIRDKLLMIMPEEDWDRVIEVNLKGAFVWTKAVSRTMISQRQGRIINIVSPSALTGRPGQANYAASKGGLISFTKTLSKELGRFDITANAVCPGLIETDMLEKMDPDEKKNFLKLIPMNKYGSPEDVAGAVLFFASNAANYITGQILCVDGGLV